VLRLKSREMEGAHVHTGAELGETKALLQVLVEGECKGGRYAEARAVRTASRGVVLWKGFHDITSLPYRFLRKMSLGARVRRARGRLNRCG
jgi:hypothetical protein